MTDTEGLVVESFGRRVRVRLADGAVISCNLRGRRLDVAVGDQVTLTVGPDRSDGIVESRLPRRNVLARCDSRGLPESIAANLDQLAVVVAPQPVCDPFIVDRYAAGAWLADMVPLVIVNKGDLDAEGSTLDFLPSLERAGMRVLRVSAKRREGLPALIEALRDRRTLFVGQSGVGKSSLLNALLGADTRTTRALSDSSGEGRHTSVSSAIFACPWGEIADSPGVRDFAPALASLPMLQHGFPEIAAVGGQCRFQDCLHLREPQCEVQARVLDGRIDARRHESYRRLVNLTRQLVERRGPRG